LLSVLPYFDRRRRRRKRRTKYFQFFLISTSVFHEILMEKEAFSSSLFRPFPGSFTKMGKVFQFFLISTINRVYKHARRFSFSSSLFRLTQIRDRLNVNTFQFFLISTLVASTIIQRDGLSVLPYFDQSAQNSSGGQPTFSSSLFRHLCDSRYREYFNFQFFLISTMILG